jgi:hypothetical protein
MGFAIAARAAGALDGALAVGLPAGPEGVGGEAVGDAMVVVGDGDGDVTGVVAGAGTGASVGVSVGVGAGASLGAAVGAVAAPVTVTLSFIPMEQ